MWINTKFLWSFVVAVVLGNNFVDAQYGDIITGKALGGYQSLGHGVGQRVGHNEFVVGSSLKVADDDPYNPHSQSHVVHSGYEGLGHSQGHNYYSQQPFNGGRLQNIGPRGFTGPTYFMGGHEFQQVPLGPHHGFSGHPRLRHGHNMIHSGHPGGYQMHHGGHHGGHYEVHRAPQYHHVQHMEPHHGRYVGFRGYGNYGPAYSVGAGVGHHHTGHGHQAPHHTTVMHQGYAYVG